KPREGIELIGIVSDDPALRKSRGDKKEYWSFGMRVEAVSRVGMFQKARGEVQVRLPQNEIQPRYGERWHLRGVLIDKYRLPDLSRTEASKRVIPQRFLFYASRQSVPVLLTRASRWSLLHWCFTLRQKCADILACGITHRPDVAGILQALLLGRRYELPAGLREAFVATGTYHIFAISGQHVAIIALFIVFVLQIYGIGRLKWFYYLAPALIIFTIMAGMSASAVRGCIMALMCFLGPLFKRKTDISSAMALAALLIVGADPRQLFQAGFLLSFGIVAGLIVLCPPLIAMVEMRIASDPYQLEPEKWPARNARNVLRWILFLMSASFTAWLVSLPLAARWFNLVSLVALPANLIVIPMATLVLLTGCLSIISGFLCPFVAEVFNFANVAFVSLTTGVTKALAQIPFGHIFVRSPPLWFVCLWFGVLIVWRVCHAKGVINYQQKKVWLAAVFVLIIAGGLAWQLNRKEWEIHVLNVNNSAVCLVSTDKANNLLLNTGPNYQARNVLGYLRKMGVNRIQVLACPIPDAKHIGAAKEIITALPVIKIRFGAKNQRARSLNELYAEADKRRIGTGELTNKLWRIKPDGRDWLIDGADRYQKTDLAESFSAGPVSIFINSADQTQMTARFLINGRHSSTVIDVEENQFSGFLSNACFGASAEIQCRIVCGPAAENKDGNYCAQLSDFQPSGTITLGPGQGVVIAPDRRKINMTAMSLFP
ncbi:MAG: ComEC/Rec2 family competence protein, partial [Kiritimatiellia bacterium]|nr:ComEC/Rec2 family competence protein [Kiritimatiellia bacterium]